MTAHFVEIAHTVIDHDPIRVGPYANYWDALIVAQAVENGQVPLPLPLAQVRADVVPLLFTESELPRALDKLAERVIAHHNRRRQP